MSDHKHNPLSPEELFRLLDKKTNSGNEMDEFEQDALDGFAILGSSEKAKALVEEMNTVISKKVSGSDDKGTQKNRIIWFSAAATIVLIVMISIFFLNQSKKDSTKELALNELAKKEELVSPDIYISDESAPAEAVNKGVKGKESDLTSPSKGIIPSEKKAAESNPSTANQPALSESVISFGAGKEAKDEERSYEQKNRNDQTTEKNAIIVADKLEVNKKTQTVTEESESDNGYNIAQNSVKGQSDMDNAKELSEKVDTDSKNEDKSYKSKSKSNDAIVRSEMSTKTSSAPAAADVNQDLAYYPGGVLAIKEYVLLYIKSKTTKVIIGKYKVTATAFKNGTMKVNSIIQISREFCDCTENITEALNTTEKWVPLSNAGFPEDSEVGFILVF